MEVPPQIEISHRTEPAEYTLDEFVEFNLQLFAPQIRSQRLAFFLIGAGTVVFSALSFSRGDSILGSIGIALASVFFLRPLFAKEMIKSAAKKIHDNPSSWLRTKRTVALTTGGVKSEGEDGSYNFTPWRSVRRVIQGTLIDILVLDSNMGIIVPRRAFPDERARQNFVQFARESLVFGEKAP